MQPVSLEKLLAAHPEFQVEIIPETKMWGKLICHWDEKKANGVILHHIFSATIHLKNKDVYFDCRRRKIWAKMLSLSFTYPLLGTVKTLYHLSMIPVAKEIFNSLKGEQTVRTGLKNSVKSIADIVRTPLYAVVLLVISVASTCLIIVHPNAAYGARKLYGDIERSLNWGDKESAWILSKCFQSKFNLETVTDPEKMKDFKRLEKKYKRKLAKIENDKTLSTEQKAKEKKSLDWKWYNKQEEKGIWEDRGEWLSQRTSQRDDTDYSKIEADYQAALTHAKERYNKDIKETDKNFKGKAKKRIKEARRKGWEREKTEIEKLRRLSIAAAHYARWSIRDRQFNGWKTPFYWDSVCKIFQNMDRNITYVSRNLSRIKPKLA